MKTRSLTAVGPDGQVYTRTTHRAYAVVVVYQDGRRPTWHETRRGAERALGLHPTLTDLDRRRRTRRLRTSLTRSGVWVTTFLTRRKLYPPTRRTH